MKTLRLTLSLFLLSLVAFSLHAQSPDINLLIRQAREKIDRVNTYEAKGKMKTNVTFLKVPIANITMYFSKPNKLRIKSEKGVSFIPKGAVSINLGQLLQSTDFTVIDAGTEMLGKTEVRVAKLLPNDDNSDVVLSTIYIDPAMALIRKARTTTRENGTYELEMNYGKYMEYGLPDKIFFSFNTKDYKLPKGVTFDFDDGSQMDKPKEKAKNKKGRAEISISSYIVNQALPPGVFVEAKP